MEVLDILNDIQHCLAGLQHQVDCVRASVFGNLYTVDELMTRKEAADFLGRSERSIDRLCSEHKIKKEVVNGQVRIRKSVLMAYKGIVVTETKKPETVSELDKIIGQYK